MTRDSLRCATPIGCVNVLPFTTLSSRAHPDFMFIRQLCGMTHQYKSGRPARDDGPTVNVTFRLSQEAHKALLAHVFRRQDSKSSTIREALELAGLLTFPESS